MILDIRTNRKKLKMSVEELSEKTGIDYQTLCRIEKHEANYTTVGNIIKIADALQVSVEQLIATSCRIPGRKE